MNKYSENSETICEIGMTEREEPEDSNYEPDGEQIDIQERIAQFATDWAEADGKMDFSKKGMIFFEIIEVILVIFACVVVFIVGDATPVYWALTAITAEAAVYSAMYMWKTKCLNRAKYAQRFFIELAENYGPDIAVRVAEFVLMD